MNKVKNINNLKNKNRIQKNKLKIIKNSKLNYNPKQNN